MKFNVPVQTEKGYAYIKDVIQSKSLCGDGKYTKLCHSWMEEKFHLSKALLTTSGTAALEMAALLTNIKEGDEVIMPSYTFVSVANAFVLRGARIIFCDIRPDTMNLDETLIEEAITDKTKAIVAVQYAGVSCEMDIINAIAKKHSLYVIEDAAQAFLAKYKGRYCGTLGDLGCFSFHETKNYTMGEGGALAICGKDPEWKQRAEIIREKGTNRSSFFRGEVDKYSWLDVGSSYLPSDINAAYLYAQLEMAGEINKNRMISWNYYREQLLDLHKQGVLEIAQYPEEIEHNAHMFWIKAKDLEERQALLTWLKKNDIPAAFHYVPLHSSLGGEKYGCFVGEDRYTTKESERLLRLPLYYDMDKNDIDRVCEKVAQFYRK